MLRVTIVGCGGVFYHTATSLATCLNSIGGEGEIICVDPDTVEVRNISRQWAPTRSGDNNKAARAAALLTELCPDFRVASAGQPVMQTHLVGRDLVICVPDSYTTRYAVYRELVSLSKGRKEPVVFVTAGNDGDNGWACGSLIQGGKTSWCLLETVPSIIAGTRAELSGEEGAMGCGLREEDFPGQTAAANLKTAALLQEAVYTGVREGEGGLWRWDQDGPAWTSTERLVPAHVSKSWKSFTPPKFPVEASLDPEKGGN